MAGACTCAGNATSIAEPSIRKLWPAFGSSGTFGLDLARRDADFYDGIDFQPIGVIQAGDLVGAREPAGGLAGQALVRAGLEEHAIVVGTQREHGTRQRELTSGNGEKHVDLDDRW